VGAAVSGLAPGQRVLALVDHGAFAEKALARSDDVVPLPDDIDDITAAGLAIAYGTAYGALAWRADLHAGETLLVHGAAGGAGLAAVECGKAMGARVLATARGADKLATVRDHGADAALDSEDPDLVARIRETAGIHGIDVAFDPVGGRMFDASLRTIAWEGRIIVVGFASGVIPQIPANILLVKNAAALGFYWGSYRKRDPERLREAFDTLFAWKRTGRINPHVSHALPLERVTEALTLLIERRSTGKVVLAIG
jgi:NADPH2:quinone reductase